MFGGWAGVRFRRHANYREIGILLPFTLVGLVAGLALLLTLNERVLMTVSVSACSATAHTACRSR